MQSFKKKARSAKGKAVTLLEVGIDPYLIGKENFENPNNEVDELASKRKEKCVSCELFEDEVLESCMITDVKIPELSNKMCGDCFCILSYKLRQSISKCKLWQE